VARVEPATNDVTARAEQEAFDKFVYCDDPQQTHLFDLLIRELLTDKTGQFGIRLQEIALVGRLEGFRVVTDILHGPVVVLEETAPENGDFDHGTGLGRLKVRASKHPPGIVFKVNAFAPEPCDPALAGRAVCGERGKIDDAIFLTPLRFFFVESDILLIRFWKMSKRGFEVTPQHFRRCTVPATEHLFRNTSSRKVLLNFLRQLEFRIAYA